MSSHEHAITNHNQAAQYLDQSGQAVAQTQNAYHQDAERRHNDAQNNLDEISRKVQEQREDNIEGLRKRTSSKGRANSKGRATSKGRSKSRGKKSTVTTTNSMSETSKLDVLREEQQRRFQAFNVDLEKVNKDYHEPYGKTSFGTPVNKDAPRPQREEDRFQRSHQNDSGMMQQSRTVTGPYQATGLKETE